MDDDLIVVMIDPEKKRELQVRAREYRKELDTLKRELAQAHENFMHQKGKEALFSTGPEEVFLRHNSGRKRKERRLDC